MSSSKAGPSARWFGGWRRTPRLRQPDFADFGTAFGLDLSLSLSQQPMNDALPAVPPAKPAARSWRLGLKRRRSA